MEPVLIVSGKWVKKHRYVFNADERGCRVMQLDEKTSHDDIVKLVLDDYGLKECSHQIKLSYMFSNKTLKTMALDTPPVYVSNTRQLQGFLSLRKIEQLRLCVEIKSKKGNEISRNDGSSVHNKKRDKRSFSSISNVESTYDEYGEGYDAFSDDYSRDERTRTEKTRSDHGGSKNHGEEEEADGREYEDGEEDDNGGSEDEDDKEIEDSDEKEDGEFDSRFDMFDDSDGASSDDDNFTSFGATPTPKDEDSPPLPPKKRPRDKQSEMIGSRGNPEVLRLEMAALNLAVGQRYESKDRLERRLKLLAVRDGFDYDVDVSNPETLIVKCWVDGCRWRVRASTQGDSPAFHVRIYESEHTCSVTERSNRSRQATPDILGELYRDYLGDVGPSVKPKSVGITFNKQFGIKVIATMWLVS